MTLVEAGHEAAPGVRLRAAPGHNRDMAVVTVESGGQAFCFLSDLVPTAAHLPPTWVAAFDLFPLETIENKERWLGTAADEGFWCGFGHDPERPFARICRDGKTGFQIA
jgi:glyoxylase-like metal-dependent hydrolase (beta-lactamase superfamily II)